MQVHIQRAGRKDACRNHTIDISKPSNAAKQTASTQSYCKSIISCRQRAHSRTAQLICACAVFRVRQPDAFLLHTHACVRTMQQWRENHEENAAAETASDFSLYLFYMALRCAHEHQAKQDKLRRCCSLVYSNWRLREWVRNALLNAVRFVA